MSGGSTSLLAACLLAAVTAPSGGEIASAGIIPVDTAPFDDGDSKRSRPSPLHRQRPLRTRSSKRVAPTAASQRRVQASQGRVGGTVDASPSKFSLLEVPGSVLDAPESLLKLPAGAIEVAAQAPPEPDPAAPGQSPTDENPTDFASQLNSDTRVRPAGDPAWGFFLLVLVCFGGVLILAACGATVALYRRRRDARHYEREHPTCESGMNSAWDQRERRRIHAGEASASLRFLGLDETAAEAEVLAAYRQLALRSHPDHNGDPRAFKALHLHFERALKQVQSSRRRERT